MLNLTDCPINWFSLLALILEPLHWLMLWEWTRAWQHWSRYNYPDSYWLALSKVLWAWYGCTGWQCSCVVSLYYDDWRRGTSLLALNNWKINIKQSWWHSLCLESCLTTTQCAKVCVCAFASTMSPEACTRKVIVRQYRVLVTTVTFLTVQTVVVAAIPTSMSCQ